MKIRITDRSGTPKAQYDIALLRPASEPRGLRFETPEDVREESELRKCRSCPTEGNDRCMHSKPDAGNARNHAHHAWVHACVATCRD